MHDFFLAKEIIDAVLKISAERKLSAIKAVSLEIGSISLAHDGFPEHAEEIDLANLKFALQNITKGTNLEKVDFVIKKVPGESWKITNIEVE